MGHSHHHHEHVHYHRQANERSTQIVVAISVVAMLLELSVGYSSKSVTLIMDGWHMLSHVLVLLLAWGAYLYIRLRRHELTQQKEHRVLALSSFASAVALLIVTAFMVYEAIEHFMHPEIVVTKESFAVAIFSLFVNAISAYVLHREEEKMDLSLKAAYIHVLSDVVLSCFAIASLTAIYFAGINWLDPLLGLVGSAVIIRWSIGLIKQSWRDALR
ncbi:MAG: cation diffusion facilitator family transporter [Chitinophagales bacterium]|nr:cation transporter [Chitinophagales bacterium]MCO5281084.1 cation diffusion facilitator family transporter [Chitinophagales bacterium]HRP40374.1 cation diffusion facilitator family transporter [Chitinophagales bacterium]